MIVARPAARSGRQRRSVRVSAPGVVPFVVTNRTGKRNRAGRVPVVRPFIAACHVAGWWSPKKTAFRNGLLVCRGGIRTFAAAGVAGERSRACLLGALAAAPGSVAMLAHRRMAFRAVLARWRFRFQAGLEFFPFAWSHHFYVSNVWSA